MTVMDESMENIKFDTVLNFYKFNGVYHWVAHPVATKF